MDEDGPPNASLTARAEAKHLIRTVREAGLATLERESGSPFATLVGMASDYDGAPLLLLSTLSRHTRNLAADARCSLLLVSPRRRGDALNRPRLTLVGTLRPHAEPAAKARYLARNPKAKLYAGFADFAVLRMEVSAVHFNGGFARAAPLAPADIRTDMANAEELLGDEAALLHDINARGPAFLGDLAEAAGRRIRWRAIGLDPDGLDLAAGAGVARVSFSAPAKTPAAWRHALDAFVAADGRQTR